MKQEKLQRENACKKVTDPNPNLVAMVACLKVTDYILLSTS